MEQEFQFRFTIGVKAASEEEALRYALQVLEKDRQENTLEYQKEEKGTWKSVNQWKPAQPKQVPIWTNIKVQKEFESFTRQFLKEYGCEDTQEINQGYCGDYACIFMEYLHKEGQTHWQVLSIADFLPDKTSGGIAEDTSLWDKEKREKYGISETAFHDFREKLLQEDPRGYVGYHVWLYDGERHYDAECSEETKNPLTLPFFQRFLR